MTIKRSVLTGWAKHFSAEMAKGDAHVERIAHAVHAVGVEGLLLAGADRIAVRRVGDRHVPHLCEVRLDLQT